MPRKSSPPPPVGNKSNTNNNKIMGWVHRTALDGTDRVVVGNPFSILIFRIQKYPDAIVLVPSLCSLSIFISLDAFALVRLGPASRKCVLKYFLKPFGFDESKN